MSGWKEVILSFGIGALGYVTWLPTYGRMAASVVAAGVFMEGCVRVKAELARRSQRDPLTLTVPESSDGLGQLKAAFVTRNSIVDSLILACLVVAMGCGLAWVADFMDDAQGAVDGNTLKAVFCMGLLPCVMLYVIYRGVRLKLDRRAIYVYQNGFHYDVRGNGVSIPWEDVRSLTAMHLGDAIDEDAIDFECRVKHKKMRITRGQFPQIQRIWERLLQEADEEIGHGRIEIHARIHGKPGYGY